MAETKRKVLCPECDKEVEITRDEDGEDLGTCGNCKLNVGRILTRRRHARAEEKLEAQEKAERVKLEKKTGKPWWKD